MDLDPGTGHDCANLDRPMMPEDTLTLDELQAAKDTLEAKAAALRQTLHALHASAQADWRAQFAHTQVELIRVVTEIGGLNRAIYKRVEGEAEPQKDPSLD